MEKENQDKENHADFPYRKIAHGEKGNLDRGAAQ